MKSNVLSTTNSTAAFILRLALGIVMLAHGMQQTLGWLGGIGLSKKLAYYHSLGVPKALGFIGIMTVSVGAIFLILGFWSRIMAFFTLGFLTTALFMGGHLHHTIFMNWEGQRAGEGFEYHILAIGICVALLIIGGGRWSIDRYLSQKRKVVV